MKRHIFEFIRKGLTACGIGPLILVAVYLILQKHCGMQELAVSEVCVGIVSLTILAFIAGGMNVIYQIEQLPLMVAILIHGTVLYISYLVTYLINDWLEFGPTPLLVFTGIFIVGYLTIWGIIYAIIRKRTTKINEILKTHHQNEGSGPCSAQ